ncbi:MAG: UDP-N-acetylmuramoyl-L-alanine--D-glutamate ligase [Oscillospiraceae bacterium]
MSLTITDYLASLQRKRVAVIGIGVSNTPLIQMLLRENIAVTACDKRTYQQLGDVAENLESLGATLRLGPDYLEGLDQDVIFRTPGMRPDVPELLAAQERGSVITSEMEAFFQVCPCPIIAVTGSDGKTTTTSIISGMLKAAGYSPFVGGNIGKPLLADSANMVPDDIAVLELSSFQLMTMQESPHIAVVTNLAPNHLDIHKSLEEYYAAKKNIFTHQRADDRVILNQDNEVTRSFAGEAPGVVTLFSRREVRNPGICVRDGVICVNGREVLPVSDILLPGDHNIENYMAAIGAVDGLVSDELIRTFAKPFAGVEHRIAVVRTLNGVKYYNDSIASSPSRTTAGLRSFTQKVILIAGGYDKKIPFDDLGPVIADHVKALCLTGDTAAKIRVAVENAPNYQTGSPELFQFNEFREAVLAAHRMAQPGDIVILSPACASFDKFKNFMERGNAFKEIIHQL